MHQQNTLYAQETKHKMKTKETFKTSISGTQIQVHHSDLAENASGSVMVEAGGTVVMATATVGKEDPSRGYFPLSVDFEERFYSSGKILGSRFMRREGRPSTDAVLNARIIDRSIRPLFPKGFMNETQVVITVLSIGEYDSNMLALLGASIALGSSQIPWGGSVSGVCVSLVGSSWKTFPTTKERKESDADLIVCGRGGNINMIEMGGKQIPEEEVTKAVETALSDLVLLEKFQEECISALKKEKMSVSKKEIPSELEELFNKNFGDLQKQITEESTYALEDKWNSLVEKGEINKTHSKDYFNQKVDEAVHKEAIENGKRVDGRGMDEVRPLYAKAGGVSKRLHGTGIFYRGGTHVFTALTLSGPEGELLVNTPETLDSSFRFMHHYNFPPFAGGETGRINSTNRREIGHGALAEKAIAAVLPEYSLFPYTIRLVSECFASNGSTSMGSVCASTLALMDGGVQIEAPVAGIAMGLMQSGDKHVVLTDIQGPEDHHGDMDLKIAGTEKGVTAMQMDVKIEGISLAIFKEALDKARTARIQILQTITKEIAKPRENISEYAPKIKTISVNPEMIGLIIGSGGKTIKEIKESTGVEEISIEDDGTITLVGKEGPIDSAIGRIEDLTKVIEVGEEFDGEVTGIKEFGAFVKITPKTEGMVHISEFSPKRIDSVESLVSVGDTLPVVVKEVNGDRIRLSVKERNPKFFNN